MNTWVQILLFVLIIYIILIIEKNQKDIRLLHKELENIRIKQGIEGWDEEDENNELD